MYSRTEESPLVPRQIVTRNISLYTFSAIQSSQKMKKAFSFYTEVVGFMSMKATIYLADVLDHMEHILTCLDMYEAMVENLANFTFNVCFHGICSRLQHYTYHFIDDL